MRISDDFRVMVIYINSGFVEHCTPQSNYGMKGQLALFMNPVMKLNEAQFALCLQDFQGVKYRYDTTGFVFYEESIRCAVQLMILDFFDFHAYNYGEDSITPQYAAVMNKFFALLDSGVYREHREVTYYASELCITPKYLSEICKKVSGHSANFWINRYTSLPGGGGIFPQTGDGSAGGAGGPAAQGHLFRGGRHPGAVGEQGAAEAPGDGGAFAGAPGDGV